jgi:hypothetical protein
MTEEADDTSVPFHVFFFAKDSSRLSSLGHGKYLRAVVVVVACAVVALEVWIP